MLAYGVTRLLAANDRSWHTGQKSSAPQRFRLVTELLTPSRHDRPEVSIPRLHLRFGEVGKEHATRVSGKEAVVKSSSLRAYEACMK